MTEARQLHDLAVVDEEVDVDTKLPDVPVVHGGVSSLEHDTLLGELLHDPGDNVGPPRGNVLGDTLRFDHKSLDTGVKELVAQVDQLAGVGGSDVLEAGCRGVTTRTELDAQLRLSLELIGMDLVHKAEPVLLGERKETGGELNDIEAETLSDVLVKGAV